ncbi:MAG TPA: phosphatase PAP2 family protein [Gemmatimonadaceae bacterium]
MLRNQLVVAGLALSAMSAPVVAQQSSDTSQVQKTFFTRRDAAWSGVALAASAGVSIFDVRISNWFQTPSVQGTSSRHDVFKSLTVVNEQPLALAAVATYGIGKLTGSATVADVGLHATEALVLTVGVSEAIRGPLGRLRPRVSQNDQYDFKFWRGFTDFAGRSYPSLHAAVGFATASVLVGEMRERHASATPYLAPVLYAAAMVPGITRLYLDEHWASDVVAGAFVGTLLGSRVVHYAHTHKRNKLDRFLLGTTLVPDGHGGVLVMKTFGN